MAWGQISVVLLNLAAMVEGVDDVLLPAVFGEMAGDFGVGLAALGSLTFVRGVVQALGSPVAAYWSQRYNRVHIIAAGALCWAAATALVGIARSYWEVVLARVVNGIGLAVIGPAIMSLVADVSADEVRGMAFGLLFGAGQLGTALGGIFATHMGQHKFMGMAGWRAAFLIVALICVVLGIAIFLLGHDPRAGRDYSRLGEEDYSKTVEKDGRAASVREFVQGAKLVLRVKTFQIIAAQGIVGSIPHNALVFLTLWMQLVGFSHSAAAFIVALLALGNAVGSILGGWIGDKAARLSRNKGRIACAQFSSGTGIATSAILLLALPKEANFHWAYVVVIFSMGTLMSWGTPATSGPIFAEIVPEELRTTVYALDLALERFFAVSGAPLVGVLAGTLFGFKTLDSDEVISQDVSNATALGHALFACISVPYALCIIILSLLYFTYPKDREQAKTVQALGNEIRNLEMGEQWEEVKGSEDKLWDDGWDSLDDEEIDLGLLIEREAQIDQRTT